jgi:hypothetical protein
VKRLGLSCSPEEIILSCGWCGTAVLSWLHSTGSYLAARQRNSDVCAIRYEDLVGNESGLLTSLFQYIGIPLNDLHCLCRASKRDSQAGTSLRRTSASHPFDSRTRKAISKAIACSTALRSPAVILDGTLLPVADPGR